MFIVKNLQETVAGHLECEILDNGTWSHSVIAISDEYEIHDSSDWPNIKPCDPIEKEENAQEEMRAHALNELAALDVPLHTLALAIVGDEVATRKIKDAEEQKVEIRKRLITS